MALSPVIFIRGLNSYGEDRVRIGPLSLGYMHKHWQRHLTSRGIVFLPLLQMGACPVQEQAKRAQQILCALPEWKNIKLRFHLLGHSSGGLVARILLDRLAEQNRFLSLTTIACPHEGSLLAEAALQMSQGWAPHTLRALGYSLSVRENIFTQLTPLYVKKIIDNLNSPPNVALGSVICQRRKIDLSWPLQLLHRLPMARVLNSDHDGIVETTSQSYGTVLATMPLDHLESLGFAISPRRMRRVQTRKSFSDLVNVVIDHWQKSEINR